MFGAGVLGACDIIPKKSLAAAVPARLLLPGLLLVGACISNKDAGDWWMEWCDDASKKLCIELDAEFGIEGGAE